MSDLAQIEETMDEQDQANPEILSMIPLFGGLAPEMLSYFVSKLQRVNLIPGQVVYDEGDAAHDLYIVATGSCAVYKPTSHGDNMLNTLKPRDFFGDMSFIDMQHRSATVRAHERSVLWRLSYSALREAYLHDPKSYTLVVMNIAREMSRRLRRADYQRHSGQESNPVRRKAASVIGRIGMRSMTVLRRNANELES